MAKTRLTDENVIDILGATNLESKEVHTDDPLVKSRIRVTLDQLKPYDNNPRASRNPKFDDILSSIENAGLDQPPNISRRSSDAPHYIIIDGGNTRLEILNLLYEKYTHLAQLAESDGERLYHSQKAESFYVIDCIFKPWVSESKALTGHMSENENRGNMLLIEKALAVRTLRQFYETEDREKARVEGREYEDKPISTRSLAERITTQGWTIHHSHISRYDYAANTLLKAIPNAFWAGAGHSLVRQVRKYDAIYERYWRSTEAGQAEPERIKTLFLDTLRLYDDENVDIQGFLRDLDNQLGKLLDIHASIVTVEIEAILHGRVTSPAPPLSPGLSSEELVKKYKDTAPQGVRGNSDTPPAYNHTGSENQTSGTHTQKKTSAKKTQSRADQEQRDATVADSSAHEGEVNTQERLFGMVHALATKYGIEIIYLSSEERGGSIILFGVAPLDRALVPGKDEELGVVWWALTKCSLSFLGDKQKRYVGFIQNIETMFQHYLKPEGPVGTLLLFEQMILSCQPEIRGQLNEIQRLCGLMIEEISTGK